MKSCSLAISCVVLFASPTIGQSVWGVTGNVVLAQQITGPGSGACHYPNGPILNSFWFSVPFTCPTAGGFGVVTGGDIAIDRLSDTVWVCDESIITNYTKAGAPIRSFPTPQSGGIRALGWGQLGALGVLWISNGSEFAAILPPSPPGCAIPIYVVPPTPVTFPGYVTDIDFDPRTGTLFMSNSNGFISNQTITGAPGPYGVFAPGACFSTEPQLRGIAVNTSGCTTLYVTNSFYVAHINMGGGLAAPTFYTPAPCFPWPGEWSLAGLAHDSSPIGYGQGCDHTSSTIPTISWSGAALSPSSTFTITLGGSDPGNAFLLVGSSPACPPPLFMNCRILVSPIALTVGPIAHAGPKVILPAALPPGMPCPLSVHVQWVNMKNAGGVETTDGLEFSVGLP